MYKVIFQYHLKVKFTIWSLQEKSGVDLVAHEKFAEAKEVEVTVDSSYLLLNLFTLATCSNSFMRFCF